MKKLFTGITSLVTLASMCLPFSVSATGYDDKTIDQDKVLSGYVDVLYPEQTCLLGDTSKLDSIWLKLVVLDDESNTVTLREFNTKNDKHSCYIVDTSSVDVNTPGTYQYSVKSLAGVTETFSVPNEKGDFEYYDVEMMDYEATASLIVSDKDRLLSLGVDNLTLEVGNTYNIEIYGYKSDELSFELTDDKVASVDMWLENEAASNYRITADSEGEAVLTFTAADDQTASIDISVVAEGSLPKTTTAVWYKDPETTTTAVTNELYFNSQYGYVPVEVGLNSGISLAGYDDGKFYEVGDSPIEFTIDDETIAKVGVVQGVGVNVVGVSVGETMLNAKTPDGRTASIKVVVKEAASTSTTAVWNESTTTTTTTTTVVADPTTKGTVQLTLNDVIELSKKGNDLTWEDFKDYISTDIGSGLYIEKYDLEDGYTLLVGGVPSDKPYYIELYRYDDSKNSIDIRTEDVAAFLDSTATMTTTVAETTTATITTTTAITNGGTEELPQTGYSGIYKVIAGLAVLMTVSGAALVIKTRKENE